MFQEFVGHPRVLGRFSNGSQYADSIFLFCGPLFGSQLNRPDCFWLYVVTNCATEPELQEPIQDPARFEWHEVS